MKIKEIEKEFNEKIIDYYENRIKIDNLVTFIGKLDPSYIYKFLENSKKIEIGHIMDMIQEYDYYKDNNNEQTIINEIKSYYEN